MSDICFYKMTLCKGFFKWLWMQRSNGFGLSDPLNLRSRYILAHILCSTIGQTNKKKFWSFFFRINYGWINWFMDRGVVLMIFFYKKMLRK